MHSSSSQPTPPPIPNQRLLPSRASLFSLVSRGSSRSGSLVNFPYGHHHSDRLSDALSFDSSAAELSTPATSLPNIGSRAELREPKPSFINLLTNMMKKHSKSKPRVDSKGKKKDTSSIHSDSTVSLNNPATSSEAVLMLNTNLDEMEEIINLDRRHGSSSLSSGVDTHLSDVRFRHVPDTSHPTFTNPFLPSSSVVRRNHYDNQNISPNIVLPIVEAFGVFDDASASWTAPESSVFGKEGVAKPEEHGSGSEEDASVVSSPTPGPTTSDATKRKSRRKGQPSRFSDGGPGSSHGKPYKIRIYRAGNTYHVVSMDLAATVADVTSQLMQKLPEPDRGVYRVYLKERNRERVLAMTERPADIWRRRLEQAGYTAADGPETLGAEDMRFLLMFIYKSTLLGPAVSTACVLLCLSLTWPPLGGRVDF